MACQAQDRKRALELLDKVNPGLDLTLWTAGQQRLADSGDVQPAMAVNLLLSLPIVTVRWPST
jgi:hypothetical protein